MEKVIYRFVVAFIFIVGAWTLYDSYVIYNICKDHNGTPVRGVFGIECIYPG